MQKNKKCCIVFVTHKEKLCGSEKQSLDRTVMMFSKKYDMFIVIPKKCNTYFYDEYGVNVINVNDEWLKSWDAYNKMCMDCEFYSLFKGYDYILLTQSDCWFFHNNIEMFIEKGFDYYGAPWPYKGGEVGNGGLSLRKVSKMIEICNNYKDEEKKGNEDLWFCRTVEGLNKCDLKTACQFSLETMDRPFIELAENGPLGIHADFNRKYWKENWLDNFTNPVIRKQQIRITM